MTAKEYLLSIVDWRIAQDKWVQSILNAAGMSLDDFVQRIDDIRNSEDFEKMSIKQLEWYENALGIGYHSENEKNRRASVQAYWLGDGKPSVESVRNIVSVWTGVKSPTITYNGNTQTLTVNYGTVTNFEAYYASRLAIRRHIPAHVALVTTGNISWLTIANMEAKTINETADVYIGQFKN